MILNESFYIALCFVILVAALYLKFKNLILNSCDDYINNIASEIKNVNEINLEAHKVFTESKRKLEELDLIKSEKLEHTHQDAIKIRSEYVKSTQNLMHIKEQDFARYLDNIKMDRIRRNKDKILDISYRLLTEVAKYEKLNISNKLN